MTATEIERRRAMRDRNTHAIIDLLDRRTDLHGVWKLADHVVESVAWTA
jgi:hypothetical protein